MSRSSVSLLMLAAVLALPPAAHAQAGTAAAPPQDVFFIANGAPVMPFGGRIDVLRSSGSVPGELVKDKPYSAASVTESVQILTDGNKITNRNEARIYRDSAGRTRREQTLNALGAWQPASDPVTMITINDPAAEVTYLLNTAEQTAQQLKSFKLTTTGPAGGAWEAAVPVAAPFPPGTGPGATRGVAIQIEDTVTAGTEPFNVAVPPPPGGVGVTTFRAGAALKTVTQETRVFGGLGAVASYEPNASVRNEDLGEQILEGVLARGTREIRTIPAGAIGNQRDIEIVSEQWYSPDIEAVILSRHSDPRFGETTYQLVNVAQTEPPPDLFTVPQGYTLVSEQVMGAQRFDFAPVPPPGAGAPGQRTERRVILMQPDPAKSTQ